jgi:FlaA1/EpsC-like NDP-sugar epimerase
MEDGFLVRRRFVLQAAWDAASWIAAVLLASVARYEFEIKDSQALRALGLGAIAAVVHVVAGRISGLYIHRWRYGTFEEVTAVTRVAAVTTVFIAVMNPFLLGHLAPILATILSGALAHAAMIGGRFLWRIWLERSIRHEGERERVIVFGAGDGGAQVVKAMAAVGSPYLPVAIVDDNPDLANLRIKSVAVRGDRTRLQALAKEYDVATVVIAIPSASGELVREIVQICDDAGLRTLVLPPVAQLFGAAIEIGDIRPLTEADFLGRREINTDIESVAGYLTGKRVLVTGAGGSIGSELCRQIHRFAPESVIMLDRDESALQAVQVSIEGRGLLDSEHLVVASIRDRERMFEVFDRFRPHVVFHAAALKHLPLLEMHPDEGFKTNVAGTLHLLDAAAAFGVATFVNISTDKAADASSTLGRTKRLAERLTAWAGHRYDGSYLSVRFGNVLGSRGSVLPLFRSQIERGGPVTVTHPDVTRFFMTIEEACQLVIQAGAMGYNGEVMVLDMGEPVRIADLARRLIAEADRPVQIEYTGLRPGEKMHEVLFSPDEQAVLSEHPLISRVEVPPVHPAELGLQFDGVEAAGTASIRAIGSIRLEETA